VAFAEKRGKYWRARWLGPDGSLQSQGGFVTRKAAESHGHDQESAIRKGSYTDPKAGQVTLTSWVNSWYPAQDLELNTLSTYRYTIEVHILPKFGDRALASLAREEIAVWEMDIQRHGYTSKTAREARSLLATILSDAVPQYLQHNPAARQRGKGRRGQRRIERAEKAAKEWATPLEVLLFAERCSALSGTDTDFVMNVTMAYTGMRWSEALGLQDRSVHGGTMGIDWKLYELGARFYQGRPKDGSIREVDVPPFLADMLDRYQAETGQRTCTCHNAESPWCPGRSYVFLGPAGGHFRRSNYSTRIVRPAADGWYPERSGARPRAASPVLADLSAAWPGTPQSPWPPAVKGEPFEPPTGWGVPRIAATDDRAQCSACGHSISLRMDGLVGSHQIRGIRCPGVGAAAAEPVALASWLPVRAGLTPHGLRHGHQTWLDDLGIRYVLQSERMGHEVPGMRGVYSHITPRMRADLRAGLQELWEQSLLERAAMAVTSAVPILDRLLAPERAPGIDFDTAQAGPLVARKARRQIRGQHLVNREAER
jgi:integrase